MNYVDFSSSLAILELNIMRFLSKRFLAVSLAVLLGVGIILFAWRTVSVTNDSGLSGDETGISADESWREALKVIPADSLTHLLGASAGSASSTMASVATTTTDLLGRELLTSYGLAQKALGTTPMSDAQARSISDILSGKAMGDPNLKQYTEKDLVIVPASTSTLIAYQKELPKVLADFARKNTVNEVTAVTEAINTNDPTKLLPLKDSVRNLSAFVNTLLVMKTPQSVASLQLFFVQNYSLVLSGIVDMQQVITDPTSGLRGVAKYQKGMNNLKTFIELTRGIK